MILRSQKIQKKIISLLNKQIKESSKHFPEGKTKDNEDDFYWDMFEALEKLKDIDYKNLDLNKLTRVVVNQGSSDYYMCEESTWNINKGYYPILFENNLKGRNIKSSDYMITFMKFKK